MIIFFCQFSHSISHRLIIASRNLQNEVFFEIICDLIDGIDSGSKLILLLSADIEDSVGVLAPLGLYEVPYTFYRIELATLRRKKLTHEPSIIELVLHDLAVVDREVVHHHDTLMQGVDLLERLDEGEERIHRIGPNENLCKHKSVIDT